METPDKYLRFNRTGDRRAVDVHVPLGLSGWGRTAAAEGGRQQAVLISQVGRQDGKANGISRGAIAHRNPVQGIGTHAIECSIVRKFVYGEVIGIWP